MSNVTIIYCDKNITLVVGDPTEDVIKGWLFALTEEGMGRASVLQCTSPRGTPVAVDPSIVLAVVAGEIQDPAKDDATFVPRTGGVLA